MSTSRMPAGAGSVTPESDDAREQAGDQENADAAIVTDLDAHRKAYLTLQASAALAGCGLFELAGGAYLLTRWGMAKECPDLRSVAALLERITGARA